MAKFEKKRGKVAPAISTASLPDIIFMLLFFFMVTTKMRETTLKVKVSLPKATELQKLERKSLVSYIYIGTPLPVFQKTLGTAPRIQLNDAFAVANDIPQWWENEKAKHAEQEIPLLTTSLRCDKDIKMGIITEVKQQLRKVNALKINYSALKREEVY